MKKGKVAHSPLFVMRYLHSGAGTQASAVVPQKIVRTSVGRHVLRRKIYESLHPLMADLVSGTHMIVFAKETAISKEVPDMQAELKNLFVKAGLLRYH